MDIPDLRDRGKRALYLEIVGRELGHPLSYDRHEQDHHDLWALIDCCLSYSGGLHILVEAMEGFNGPSKPMIKVMDLVAELLPDPLLKPLERRRLGELVQVLERAELDAATIDTLYRRAVGPFGPQLGPGGVHRLAAAVAQLEETAAGPGGMPPLLVFIAELVDYADPATAVDLRDWSAGCAHRLGLDQAVRALPAQVKRATVRTAYLVIECLPDGAGAGFLTSAWLQYDDEPGMTLRCDDEPQPLTRLPKLLEELVMEDHRVVNRSTPELTIEFVLPRGLLNTPVDQFMITFERLARRVGIEYPVVVRSHDRLHRRTMHHNWRRRWIRFRERPEAASAWLVERPREHDDEWLYATLAEHTCLAMAFPPREDAAVDELWIGLQAGIPILIWCRTGGERYLSEFRELVQADLESLPQRVLRLRQDAVKANRGADHLGFHLTLIYDNADRLPAPYVPLRPPT